MVKCLSERVPPCPDIQIAARRLPGEHHEVVVDDAHDRVEVGRVGAQRDQDIHIGSPPPQRLVRAHVESPPNDKLHTSWKEMQEGLRTRLSRPALTDRVNQPLSHKSHVQ